MSSTLLDLQILPGGPYGEMDLDVKQVAKGQLISKCLYEIIVWTKIPMKILIVSALALSGQKLSNYLLVFWSKRRLQKDIMKLTDHQ